MPIYGPNGPVTLDPGPYDYDDLKDRLAAALAGDEAGRDLRVRVALAAARAFALAQAGIPTVTISGAIVRAEGNAGATNAFIYTVTRSSGAGAASIPWAFDAGSTSASDYVSGALPTGGLLAMGAGVTTATITINIFGDATVEPDEMFTVSISAPNGYAAGPNMSATGTVLNDDTAPAPTVTISSAIAKPEGDSGTTPFVYTVTRSATTGAVDVPWTFAAGNTSATDFIGDVLPAGGTLSFAAGVASMPITINVKGETVIEGDETFTVSITVPNGYAPGASTSATGTIQNDDAAPPTVALSGAVSQNEGNSGSTIFTYTVTRSASAGAVSVPWSFVAGTTSADDFVGGAYPTGGNVAIADGVSTGTFQVLVQGDTVAEPNEQFSVSIAAPSGYALGSPSTATGTILNDDASVRRTNASTSYNFGRLTKQGYGSVALNNVILGLMKQGADLPTSWTIGAATTGTDTHWTRSSTSRTPVPSAAGVTAGLSDATYSFPVTATFADNTTESCVINITALSDVATIGEADTRATWWTAHSAAVSGKVVELATGSDLTGQRAIITQWRPAAVTTLRPSDVARVTGPTGWEFSGILNLTIDDYRVSASDGTNVLGRFTIQDDSGVRSENVTLNRPQYVGTDAFFTSFAVARNAFRLKGVTNLTVNDAYIERVASGIAGSATTADGSCVNVVFNRLRVRKYFDNALITGYGGPQQFTLNDCVYIAPMRVEPGLHVDFLQVHDNSNGEAVVNINRCMSIRGEGTAEIQGIYGGASAANIASADTSDIIRVDGYVYIGAAVSAVNLSFGKNILLKRINSFYQRTNLTQPAIDQTYTNACGAFVELSSKFGAASYAGACVMDRVVVFGTGLTSPLPANWTSSNTLKHNGQGYNYATATAAVPPDYVTPGYYDADPTAALAAIDYPSLSFDAVVTAVKNVIKPKLNGTYRLPDGSYMTALYPDGTWATDAAYTGAGAYNLPAPTTAKYDGDSRTANGGARGPATATTTITVLGGNGAAFSSIGFLQSILGNPFVLREGYQHAVGATTTERMVESAKVANMATTGNPAQGVTGIASDAIYANGSDGVYTPYNHLGSLVVSASMSVNDKPTVFDSAKVGGHPNAVAVRSMENVIEYLDGLKAGGKALVIGNEFPMGRATYVMEARTVSGGTCSASNGTNFVDGETYGAPGVIGAFASGTPKRLTKVASAPGQDQYTVSAAGLYTFGGTAPTNVWLNYSAFISGQQITTTRSRVMNEWYNSQAPNFVSTVNGINYALPGFKAKLNVVVADTWNALLDTSTGADRWSLPGTLDSLQLHHTMLGGVKAAKAFVPAWNAAFPNAATKVPPSTRNNWYAARGSGGTTAYSGTLPPSMRVVTPTLISKNGVPIGRVDTGTGAITAGNGSTDIVSGSLNFSTGAWTITVAANGSFANGAVIWFEQSIGNYDVANYAEGTIGRNMMMNGMMDMTPASGTNLGTTTGSIGTAIGSLTAAQVPYGWSLTNSNVSTAVTNGTMTVTLGSETTADGYPRFIAEIEGSHTAAGSLILTNLSSNPTTRLNAGDGLLAGLRLVYDRHTAKSALYGFTCSATVNLTTAAVTRSNSSGTNTGVTTLSTRNSDGATGLYLDDSIIVEWGKAFDLYRVTPLLDTSGTAVSGLNYAVTMGFAANLPCAGRFGLGQGQLRRRNDLP